MPLTPARLVVLGSLNMDMVARVDRLPTAGETISGSAFEICRGGKGANQLLAAARHGARVAMIGCVGADAHGDDYLAFLAGQNVDIAGIGHARKQSTGTALIAVDGAGENQIIYCAGANGALGSKMVRAHAGLIRGAAVLLLQLESPLAAVLEGISIANRAGVKVILNPSPWRADFPWGHCRIDTLVLNEGEAACFFGQPAAGLFTAPAQLRQRLALSGIGRLVITRGARSTLGCDGARVFESATLPLKAVVDSVGAGDAFTGVLAVRLAEAEPLERAVAYANAAGALAAMKPGAQGSLPTRAAVQRAEGRLKGNAIKFRNLSL